MKYFIQFSGNEKLIVKSIIIFQIIITILLTALLIREDPIDVYFENEQLQILCHTETKE